VGEVHSLAFEAVALAENNSVAVLDDGEGFKGVVGKPDRLTVSLKVCADINIEFELHSTAERGRWILIGLTLLVFFGFICVYGLSICVRALKVN
jgi:hypothetical protein